MDWTSYDKTTGAVAKTGRIEYKPSLAGAAVPDEFCVWDAGSSTCRNSAGGSRSLALWNATIDRRDPMDAVRLTPPTVLGTTQRTATRGGTLDAILVWLDVKLDRQKGAATLLRHAAGQHCAFHLPPTPVTRGAVLDLEASMNSLGSNLEQCATK